MTQQRSQVSSNTSIEPEEMGQSNRLKFLDDILGIDSILNCRELSKKAQKANNIWWRLSGLLGDQNRQMMYILLQALFTVATMALTVPIFLSYEMHVIFQVLKVSATVWNGGNFLLDVMPRQVVLKEKKKLEMQPIIPERPEQPSTAVDSSLNDHNASDEGYSS